MFSRSRRVILNFVLFWTRELFPNWIYIVLVILSPMKAALELKSPALVTDTMRRAGGSFSCSDYSATSNPPIPLWCLGSFKPARVQPKRDKRQRARAKVSLASERGAPPFSFCHLLQSVCLIFIFTQGVRKTRQKEETLCLMKPSHAKTMCKL